MVKWPQATGAIADSERICTRYVLTEEKLDKISARLDVSKKIIGVTLLMLLKSCLDHAWLKYYNQFYTRSVTMECRPLLFLCFNVMRFPYQV